MADTDPHLKKFQRELSSGTVSLVLLAVLDQSSEPLYGYQIAKRLEQTGDPLLGDKQSAL
jgi:PadR family transcriptional regulator PadR